MKNSNSYRGMGPKRLRLLLWVLAAFGAAAAQPHGARQGGEGEPFVRFRASWADCSFTRCKFRKISMPGDFESLTAEVEVKMASVEAPNRVMVSHLKRKFFEVGKYPVGLVAISRVKRQKDNRYTALAQVRIRNVTRNKTIEFELTQTNPYRVEGEVVLTLSEFNMPAGIIADEIPVRFGATLPMTRQ